MYGAIVLDINHNYHLPRLSWTLLLAKAVYYTFTHPQSTRDIDGRVPELYDSIRWPMLVFQTAALLEVR